jgi:hypothetical protein
MRQYPRRGGTKYGPWRRGRTVWQIADGPNTWRVQLSILVPAIFGQTSSCAVTAYRLSGSRPSHLPAVRRNRRGVPKRRVLSAVW